MARPPVVLLTDFGTRDHYAAVMKAAVLKVNPQALLLDLTHEVPPMKIETAAYLLKTSYEYFPAGSIFVNVVDPGVGTQRKILAVKAAGRYFLAPDNGLLAPVLGAERSKEIRSVENSRYFKARPSFTFHGRDIFAPAAAHLSLSSAVFKNLGPKVSSWKPLKFSCEPEVKPRRITGRIVYVDRFGNAITNILYSHAAPRFWEKAVISCKAKSAGRIRNTYGDKEGRLVALFNSFEQLEFAVAGGSAEKTFRFKAGDAVTAAAD